MNKTAILLTMNMMKYLSLLLVILIPVQLEAQKGHSIRVKFPQLANKSIILAHYLGKGGYPDDTVKLDNKGTAVFKGPKPLPAGIYFLLLPSRVPMEFLVGEEQSISLEADTINLLESQVVKGSKETSAFLEFQRYGVKIQQATKQLNDRYKKASAAGKDSIHKESESLVQKEKEFKEKLLKGFPPNSFLAVLLKSFENVNVPDFPRDASGKVTDSTFKYRYYKNHFFDNYDYADARLLRTPLYEQKIKDYLEKMVVLDFDSINLEIDRFLDRTKNNDEIFRYLLSTFFNYYGQKGNEMVGMDGVWVHIAEKYYIPYATWASKAFIETVKKDVIKLKPTLLGQKAPNVTLVELPSDHFMVARTDTALKSNPFLGNYLTINQIKAKLLVIVFWEADCGHCQKAMPIIYETYQKLKDKGVAVLAVHSISSVPGKRKWIDYINEHGMYDWINTWSPYSNDYRELYNLNSFPSIFILDEDKRIVSKHIGAERLEEIIQLEMKKLH